MNNQERKIGQQPKQKLFNRRTVLKTLLLAGVGLCAAESGLLEMAGKLLTKEGRNKLRGRFVEAFLKLSKYKDFDDMFQKELAPVLRKSLSPWYELVERDMEEEYQGPIQYEITEEPYGWENSQREEIKQAVSNARRKIRSIYGDEPVWTANETVYVVDRLKIADTYFGGLAGAIDGDETLPVWNQIRLVALNSYDEAIIKKAESGIQKQILIGFKDLLEQKLAKIAGGFARSNLIVVTDKLVYSQPFSIPAVQALEISERDLGLAHEVTHTETQYKEYPAIWSEGQAEMVRYLLLFDALDAAGGEAKEYISKIRDRITQEAAEFNAVMQQRLDKSNLPLYFQDLSDEEKSKAYVAATAAFLELYNTNPNFFSSVREKENAYYSETGSLPRKEQWLDFARETVGTQFIDNWSNRYLVLQLEDKPMSFEGN